MVQTGEGLLCLTSNLGVHNSNKPLLAGLINGKQANLFLDTGSSISIISSQTIKQYGIVAKMHPSCLRIHGVSGSVKVMGFITCKLIWDDCYFNQKLLVLDCHTTPGSVLLGWDFLTLTGCKIDAKDKSVEFGTRHYQLNSNFNHVKHQRGPELWTVNSFYNNALPKTVENNATPGEIFKADSGPNYQRPPPIDSTSNSKIQSKTSNYKSSITDHSKAKRSDHCTDLWVTDTEETDDHPNTVTRVTTANDICLKPFSRTLVKVKVHVKFSGQNFKEGNFIITPILAELEGIAVVTGLYSFKNGEADIFVMNLTKGTIEVNKGDRLSGIEFFNFEIDEQDPPESFTASSVVDDNTNEAVKKALNETLGAFPLHFNKGRGELKKLFDNYPGVLPSTERRIGKTSLMQHEIILKEGSRPVRLAAYKIPHSRRNALDKEIKGMLEGGIITKSTSEWSSPLLLVPKSDGSFRPVVDFRALNNLTIDECFPVPALEEVLLNIKKNTRVFSSLDLEKGYFQIPLHPNSRHLTAFSSAAGHFEFSRLPMGLKNAPLTFARLMTCVFQDLMDDSILSYLDDILICSDTIENHVIKLVNVFDRLQKAGLTIRPSKCRFFQERLVFLGHEISSKGIAPNNLKVKAVEMCPQPTSKKELKSYLGLSGFFRKFVKNYSTIAGPLTELLKDNSKWTWGDEQTKAFNALKTQLTNAPVLAYPDYSKPFEIYCDASAIGVGATLCQNIDGKLHPIAFASKKLTSDQQNWNVTNREMFAIAWGLKHFRTLIMGYKVKVFTDHKPLTGDLRTGGKDPHGRRARFLVTLQDFDAEIFYLPGPKNSAPDALSRMANGTDGANLDVQALMPDSLPPSFIKPEEKSKLETKWEHSFSLFPVQGEPIEPINTQIIREGLLNSDVYRPLVQALSENTLPKPVPFINIDEISLHDGLLLRQFKAKRIKGRTFHPQQQILLPEELVPRVLRWAHEGYGHLGLMKMVKLIRSKYFFPKLLTRVRKHIQACKQCPLTKGKVSTQPPGTYDPPQHIFETVFCDVLTLPISDKGNQYILVFVDHFSRYCEIVIIPDKSADSIATAFLNRWIARWGCPVNLVSDNGTEFINNIMTKLCNKLNIKRPQILPFRPQANAYVERLNRTILNILRTLGEDNRRNWCEYIPLVQGSINSTYHATTNSTPDYIVTGRDKIMPVEVIAGKIEPLYTGDSAEHGLRRIKEVRNHVHQHLAATASEHRSQREERRSDKWFKPGDKVFHLLHKQGQIKPKLNPTFEGPWTIMEAKRNRITAKCDKTGKTMKVHPDTIKPAYAEYSD